MKTIAYLLRLILFYSVLFIAGCSPSIDFYSLDGKAFTNSDLRGRWVLLNFWADWCAPCLKEIPELNHLAARSTELNLQVIGVSYDQLTNQELKNQVTKYQIQYMVMATDPIPILPFSLPPTLPTNYLLDPEGKLAVKIVGEQTAEKLIEKLKLAQQEYQS